MPSSRHIVGPPASVPERRRSTSTATLRDGSVNLAITFFKYTPLRHQISISSAAILFELKSVTKMFAPVLLATSRLEHRHTGLF
jgi:hypothetical protein